MEKLKLMLRTIKPFRFTCTVLCSLALAACSSTPNKVEQENTKAVYVNKPTQSQYLNIDWPNLKKKYVVSYYHGYGTDDAQTAISGDDKNIVLVSLDKVSGNWKAHLGAGGEEELAINLNSGKVTVLAQASPNGINLKKSSKKVSTFGTGIQAGCVKSVFSLISSKKKRDLCDSEFSKVTLDYSATEAATEVLTSLAQAALLSKMYKVTFDQEELNRALTESKIYEHLVNEAADRYYQDFEEYYKQTKVDRSQSQKFVDKYSYIQQLKHHKYITEAKGEARAFALTTTNDISELGAVINKYRGNDSDGLVADAEARLSRLIKEKYEREELEKARVAKQQEQVQMARQRKQEQERVALTNWRNNLKVGDNTFCGRIIETNNNETMYKLALSAQLSGYGSEKWVHINELYQPWRGCLNRNGQLSPRS